MNKFKNKHLKKINLKRAQLKLINPEFTLLFQKRKNFIKDNFRSNLFIVRQLKQKLGVSSLFYYKKLQKKAKHLNVNLFLKKYFLRIDIILFNLGFFSSLYSARQAILYKNIHINGQAITKINYLLKKGDIIQINKNLNGVLVQNLKLINYTSSYYEVNYKILTIIILSSNIHQSDLIGKLPLYNWLIDKYRFR